MYFTVCRQLKQKSHFMPLTGLHEGTFDCYFYFNMGVIKQSATIKGCKWIPAHVLESTTIQSLPLWVYQATVGQGTFFFNQFKWSLLIVKCDFKNWPCICAYVCGNEDTPSQVRLLITAKQTGLYSNVDLLIDSFHNVFRCSV